MTPSMINKKDVWKNILQLNKVGDTVKTKTDGTPWTKEEVQAQIHERLEWGWNGLATIYHKMQEKNPNQHGDSPQRI